MALINCKECSAEVSSTAVSCRKCGAPVAGKKTEQVTNLDSLIVLAGCFLSLPTGIFLAYRFTEDRLALRAFFGLLGLALPPLAALFYTSRNKK